MITTKRCSLVRFKEEHSDFYRSLQHDIQVRKYLGGMPSKHHINESIKKIISDSSSLFWIVKDISCDEAIGMISLEKSDLFNEIEISYEFLPNWWGQGYAGETIIEIITYAFNVNCIKSLIAITQSKNIKSRSLLEKNGMQRKQTKVMFNEEQSIYQISKEEFLEFHNNI